MRNLMVPMTVVVLAMAAAGAPQKNTAGSRLAPDKGRLRMVIDGQTVGTEDFQISASAGGWNSRADVKIQVPGSPATKISATLRIGPGERPTSYEWSVDGERKVGGKIVFEGGVANEELHQGTEVFTQQHMFGDQRVVILDNNVYHHFAILGRLYDWEKKGPQTFAVYVPQETTPGTATLESAGNQEIDGARYDLLRMRTDQLEVFLYFDKQRLMRITLPGSNVVVVRE